MNILIWTSVVLFILLLFAVSKIRTNKIKVDNAEGDLEIYKGEINALRADNARLQAALQDIKIIEDKRNEKTNEIQTADDSAIAGILNGLFDSSGSGGNG